MYETHYVAFLSLSYDESFFPISTDFVDRYQFELIKRVSNVSLILDELRRQHAIEQESYDKIRALPTSEEKMTELFSGPLESSGVQGKEIFYKILTTTESYLVDDLRRTKGQVSKYSVYTVCIASALPLKQYNHCYAEYN